MQRRLVDSSTLEFCGERFSVQYFRVMSIISGRRRFSAEIRLGSDERVILDDDSREFLEVQSMRVLPLLLISRALLCQASHAPES